VQSGPTAREMTNPAYAHQREGDPPQIRLRVEPRSCPEQRERGANQHDRHEKPSTPRTNLSASSTTCPPGPGFEVREQTEQTRHDQQDDPQVALVTFPEAGARRRRLLAGVRAVDLVVDFFWCRGVLTTIQLTERQFERRANRLGCHGAQRAHDTSIELAKRLDARAELFQVVSSTPLGASLHQVVLSVTRPSRA